MKEDLPRTLVAKEDCENFLTKGVIYQVEEYSPASGCFRLGPDDRGSYSNWFLAERFESAIEGPPQEEYTGASVSYYAAEVTHPTNPDAEPYTAECNDVVEALGMTFAEGNAFKAIWRSCAARKFGKAKKGYDNGLYDAEKVVFFGQRMVVSANAVCAKATIADNVKGSDEDDSQGSR